MRLQYEFLEFKRALQAGLERRNAQQKATGENQLWPPVLTLVFFVILVVAGGLTQFDAELSRYAVSAEWQPILILKKLTNLVLAAPYVALFLMIILCSLIVRYRLRMQEGFRLKVPELQQKYNHMGTVAGQSLFAITGIMGAGLIVNILKFIIGRPRPHLLDSVGPFGFKPFDFTYDYVSFPSGHACTAAVLATLLALWFPRYRIAAYSGLALIASSRVFVQAHYPSDVLVGFSIGIVTTLILARLLGQCGLLFRLEPGQLFPVLKNKISKKIKQAAW